MRFVFLFFLLLISVSISSGQVSKVTLSGVIKDKSSKLVMPYVNTIIKKANDSAFITGVITNDDGRFTITNISPGEYFMEASFMGYETVKQSVLVGHLSEFLDLGII